MDHGRLRWAISNIHVAPGCMQALSKSGVLWTQCSRLGSSEKSGFNSNVLGVVNPIRLITILDVRTFIKIIFPGTKLSPRVSFYESEIHIESLINTKWLITLKSVHNRTIFLCSLDVGNIDDQSRGPSIKEKIIQLGITDYLKLTCGPLNE